MEDKRHIAQSGKSAGKWVACNAKNQCRVGGAHVAGGVLHAARSYYEYTSGTWTSLATVPESAVAEWKNLSTEKKDEFRAHLQKQRETKAAAKTQKDEREAAEAVTMINRIHNTHAAIERTSGLISLGEALEASESKVITGEDAKQHAQHLRNQLSKGDWTKEERTALNTFIGVKTLLADPTHVLRMGRNAETSFLIIETQYSQKALRDYGFTHRKNANITSADVENSKRFMQHLLKIQDSPARRRFEAQRAHVVKQKKVTVAAKKSESSETTERTASGVRGFLKNVAQRVSSFKVSEF